MAKYYVESGEIRLIVQAEDPRMAALWTMHSAMEQTVSLEALDLSNDQLEDFKKMDSVAQFSRQISVSEIGLGRAEAGQFEALEIMIEWNQLAVALARLERLIDGQETS